MLFDSLWAIQLKASQHVYNVAHGHVGTDYLSLNSHPQLQTHFSV